jgi:ribosomal 30S subunit maturation factor RimM
MDLSDLIGIGKLGGPDEAGFYQVLVKPRFRELLARTDDVFLIFDSDRVFYVTISERDFSDRKLRVRFAEEGIAEERKRHREAIIAVAPGPESPEEPENLLGYTVVFQGREVGKVSDFFHNNAQFVLAVETPDGREILVPMVDYYISSVLREPGVIELTNAESLIGSALEGQ